MKDVIYVGAVGILCAAGIFVGTAMAQIGPYAQMKCSLASVRTIETSQQWQLFCGEDKVTEGPVNVTLILTVDEKSPQLEVLKEALEGDSVVLFSRIPRKQ